MKALLICPSVRPAVPHLAEDRPLVTVPILGECLVSHWIEHLAQLGAREIIIVAADRAAQVRAVVGDGARWGVEVAVVAVSLEPTPAEAAALYRGAETTGWLPAPHDLVLMNSLPGGQALPLFDGYASWYAAVLAWLPHALTPARLRVNEIHPGVWVGRRAHVSATAELIPPCWIGDQVFIEPGAVVGPAAIIEDRSVVESEARVTHSWVGPDTFVGPLTAVTTSLAWGSTLINWRTDSVLAVPDPFLLCSLASPRDAAPAGRSAAAPALAGPLALQWITAWPPPLHPVQVAQPPGRLPHPL